MSRTYHAGDEPVPGFRLVEFLGRGGFGEVWKATAPGGAEAALKIINLSGTQGYKGCRAMRLIKQVRHPHLVPVIAFWLKDEQGHLIDDSVVHDAVSLHGDEAELIVAMGLCERSLQDRLTECQKRGLPGIPVD